MVYQNLGGAALMDGWGGINVQGMEAGFRLLHIPATARPEIFQKLMILARELVKPGPQD
jgi:hypothetical protein